ncbi:MAG: pyridoxamine 5'-phosphate oxidase family protein [Pyrinomonadaceae bacterium]
MKTLNINRQHLLIALSVCVTCALPGTAQQPQRRSKEELITAAREIMTATRYCALITTDRQGRANARTMDAFAPDENMIVWFATNPLSRKVSEIRRNPSVTLYYFDRESQAYVTIKGVARLVNDSKEKARHWKDDWKAFYPDRDKSYLLVEVRPLSLEVVNTRTGIVGTSRDWQPPSVEFRRRRKQHWLEPPFPRLRSTFHRNSRQPGRCGRVLGVERSA